jgi:hypothetical protein
MITTHSVLYYWPNAQTFSVGHVALEYQNKQTLKKTSSILNNDCWQSRSASCDSPSYSMLNFFNSNLAFTKSDTSSFQQYETTSINSLTSDNQDVTEYISWASMEEIDQSFSPNYYGEQAIRLSLLFLNCHHDAMTTLFNNTLRLKPYSTWSHNCAHVVAALLGTSNTALNKKSKQFLLRPAQVTQVITKQTQIAAEQIYQQNDARASKQQLLYYVVGYLNAWFFSNIHKHFDFFNRFVITEKYTRAADMIFDVNDCIFDIDNIEVAYSKVKNILVEYQEIFKQPKLKQLFLSLA